MDVKFVIECILQLMSAPSLEHAIEMDIANQFSKDYAKFVEYAQEWTNEYAI